MAENKKGFLLYADYHSIFKKLTDDEAGKMVKHLFAYVNDENPVFEDRILELVFEPIKIQLKRDLKNWEKKSSISAQNGAIGNLKRWYPDIFKKYEKGKIDLQTAINEAESRKSSGGDNLDRVAKEKSQGDDFIADNVNVNDNVNDSDNVISKRHRNLLPSGNGNKAVSDKKKYDDLVQSFEKLDRKEIYGKVCEFIQLEKPVILDPYVDAWNIIAEIHFLTKVEVLTDKRRNKLRSRVKECFDFVKILSVIRTHKEYKGENGSGWKVTFDHIIHSEDNWVKIQEKFKD